MGKSITGEKIHWAKYLEKNHLFTVTYNDLTLDVGLKPEPQHLGMTILGWQKWIKYFFGYFPVKKPNIFSLNWTFGGF